MAIYDGFARLYAKGPWTQHSRKMAELLPALLKRFDFSPKTLLDLACGEGTFALAMAKLGYEVTGVDASPKMLELARGKARSEGVDVEFSLGDMRQLPFRESFDLITSWFDSLNYLLTIDDLCQTFTRVSQALKPDGLFIFDMITPYGLMSYARSSVSLGENSIFMPADTPDLLVINRSEYDHGKNIATWHLTGFIREGEAWQRVDEEHKERGYNLSEITQSFGQAGFKEFASYGDLAQMSEPRPESKRVWFVLRK